MSAERADSGGEVPGNGTTYVGPTAVQIGDGNQQTNYYDQRSYHGAVSEPSAILDDFERQLRLRTPGELRVRRQGEIVERASVDRASAVSEVVEAMSGAAATGGCLLVHGEPSVGKSVLCLQAVDKLRETGTKAVVVDLRDCAPPLPTLEAAVGIPLRRLFAQLHSSGGRLLILDGAEVVQDGARDRFLTLADAAHRAGFAVVTIARDDAVAAVEEAFGVLPAVDLTKVRVEPLPDSTLDELADRFPALRQLQERRSRWLLRRVGLVDLLLRGEAVMPLRDGALSEADVFDMCWRGWVRSEGRGAGGAATPDMRERAVLEIARVEFGLASRREGPDSVVLPSLRSDGLVRSFGPGSAFRSRESFDGDVVRDFAAARLLLTDGLSVLRDAGAPRWAMRASLVACQARLLEALELDTPVQTLRELVRFFDDLATAHGMRWADVPWQAMLSIGSSLRLIRVVAPLLVRDQGAYLGQLLRVAEQRFVSAGRAESLPIEALADWLAERAWHALDVPRDVVASADRLVRDWLRGVEWEEGARDDPRTRQVRQAVRSVLMSREDSRDGHALEALATLGSDVDTEVIDRLREFSRSRPAALQPVVESSYAVMSLCNRDVELLAELALAYYIERPRKRAWGYVPLGEDGVRGHAVGYRIGVPRAAWWYGPFWDVLCRRPAAGFLVINTLVNHATTVRCEKLSNFNDEDAASSELPYLSMAVLGLGARPYAGDSHVYAWYRGGTVGPAPCTSALLAWERCADQLRAQGMGLREIVLPWLGGANSLAAVGVVIGFLVRHLPDVTDELDDFLAVPDLWALEDARTVHESSGLTIRDEEGLHGRDWRRKSFRDVAAFLAARAVSTQDEVAADRLRQVGVRLLEACPTDPDGRPPVHVRICASLLDARNYVWIKHGEGLALEYVEPADLTAELGETRRDLSRNRALYGLANRYSLVLTPPFGAGLPSFDNDLLAADVIRARDLADDPPTTSDRMLHDTVAAVAAAVVRSVGADVPVLDLSVGDRQWAWETLVVAATTMEPTNSYEGSLYVRGADRSAASAVPSLLLPAWQVLDASEREIPEIADVASDAVAACMTSTFYEVRRCTAIALRRVWAAPCGPEDGVCRHHRAWQAVEYGARDVAMAPWDGVGRRAFTRLEGDLAAALTTADAADLVLPRIGTALAAALDAGSRSCCIAPRAARLRGALIDAYARTAIHWAHEGFDVRAEDHVCLADALLAATETTPGVFLDVVTAIGGCSAALAPLLRAASTAATYGPDRRARLKELWPTLLRTVLALSEEPCGHGESRFSNEELVTALIPAPAPLTFDDDLTATIERAWDGWPTTAHLADLIPRWLPHAVGVRFAVDALIGFLRASPVEQQLRLGLPWVRSLIVPEKGTASPGSFLITEWLSSLRAAGDFDAEARAHYEVIVDALVTAGNGRARELQQENE